MQSAVAIAPSGAALAEQVVIKGDLSKLSEADRMQYYSAVCESLGLNPLTRPFEYISLNGKLTLYATRSAADQLRATRGITITGLNPAQIGDLYVVTASGRDKAGREDSSTGAVSIAGLRGEALANAMMKAETKSKRRLTLSLAGLGWTDETEIDSIPDARRVDQPQVMSLAERAAARAQEVQSQAGGSEIPVPGTDRAHVESTPPNEVAADGDASRPATPTTGLCIVASPRGAACELGAGHGGDHKRGRVSWPTPQQPGGLATPPQDHGEDAPAAGSGEAHVEAAGGVTAPADPPTEDAQDADFREIAAETFGDLVKAPVVAGEHDAAVQEGMQLLDDRPKHGKHL